MKVSYQKVKCSLGSLHVYATDSALVGIFFDQNLDKSLKRWLRGAEIKKENNTIIRRFEEQLIEFLSRKRKKFDLPLAISASSFQAKAWKALMKIPYGKTSSYTHQAEIIGSPHAVRAIGNANGQNPFPIIIPCHRILRLDGSLGGYAGGLPFKEALLRLEGALLQE